MRFDNWQMPDLNAPDSEIERVAADLNAPAESLRMRLSTSALEPLSSNDWRRLENTDSWRTTSVAQAEKIAELHGRDIERVFTGMRTNAPIPAPIVLEYEPGKLTLVAGNTRLCAARALGVQPRVLRCRLTNGAGPAQSLGRIDETLDRVISLLEADDLPALLRAAEASRATSDYVKAAAFADRSGQVERNKDTIVDAAARVLFVSAWTDREEEAGRRHRGDLMRLVPPTSPAAQAKAAELIARVERENHTSIDRLYWIAEHVPGRHYRDTTPEDFGHELGMQALGHGVSWFDSHPVFDLKVPRIEFSLDD